MDKEETPVKLLEQSQQIFERYGFRSPSMDDVAKTLGISKKTLYRYVVNKEDLITQVIQLYAQEVMRFQAEDFDQLFKFLVKNIGRLSKNSINDLGIYYPKAYQYYLTTIVKQRRQIIKDYLRANTQTEYANFISEQLPQWISDLLFRSEKIPQINNDLKLLKGFIRQKLD